MSPWIIVTGSCGLIGRELVKRLTDEFEIAALDIAPFTDSSSHKNVHFFRVDLGDPNAIEEFFKENPRPILGLVNLAAYYDFLNTPSIHYERLKHGLLTLASCYSRLKTSSSCFIQASSMACLEPVRNGAVIEPSAESFPRWEYPRFKKESEDVLRRVLVNEKYVEMVIAAVYTDFCELVPLFQFLECHLHWKLQRFFYPGDGRKGLTYVHLNDLCDAIKKQLIISPRYRRLLIGEPVATTYKQIESIVDRELFGFVIPKMRVPKWFARLGAFLLSLIVKKSFYQPWMIEFAEEHYQFDISKTREQLDWYPQRSLTGDLPQMIRVAKQHPSSWTQRNIKRPWHAEDWPQLSGIVE